MNNAVGEKFHLKCTQTIYLQLDAGEVSQTPADMCYLHTRKPSSWEESAALQRRRSVLLATVQYTASGNSKAAKCPRGGGGGGTAAFLVVPTSPDITLLDKRDVRYYFQHPYPRLFVTYFVIFCNFLLFAEDPISHSHTDHCGVTNQSSPTAFARNSTYLSWLASHPEDGEGRDSSDSRTYEHYLDGLNSALPECRGSESAMAFVRDPSQHSPRAILENSEKPKSGWLDRESNPGPPECESCELSLRHLVRRTRTKALLWSSVTNLSGVDEDRRLRGEEEDASYTICDSGGWQRLSRRTSSDRLVKCGRRESDIPVVGNVFSFVLTKYPPEWRWSLIKVVYGIVLLSEFVLMWLLAMMVGMVLGKLIIHGILFSQILRLKMFRDDQFRMPLVRYRSQKAQKVKNRPFYFYFYMFQGELSDVIDVDSADLSTPALQIRTTSQHAVANQTQGPFIPEPRATSQGRGTLTSNEPPRCFTSPRRNTEIVHVWKEHLKRNPVIPIKPNMIRVKRCRERKINIKASECFNGSWMTMFLTVIVSLYVFSHAYNLLLFLWYKDVRYHINSHMGVTNARLSLPESLVQSQDTADANFSHWTFHVKSEEDTAWVWYE
ncbi:hypothetical protein PR048_024664 [Dryococelus australis]|uniref:Uncharacterized protein n=1 Tax=Dryococelus australis TaxID=614101 RepID=A0ABQ9GP69_9NEOP|nr:hypothetical protein PR048_024664 [Dryococelus australis]